MTAPPMVLALSLCGAVIAGGAALLVRRLGRSERDRPLIAAIGAISLLIACALPFAWIRLFGTGL